MDPDEQRRTAATAAQRARSKTHASLLDGPLIRKLRLLRGLSISHLAAALGVNEGVVWRLEHGSRQNTITVSVIVDLAHVLGVRPAELIEAPSVPSPGDLVEDDDVATVGSLLSDAGGWVDIDDLAMALGWTLDRAFLALDGLERAVEVCGQRLAWSTDREVRLGAAPNSADALRDISSRDHRRVGLSEPEAKIIHLVLTQGETTKGPEQAIANVGNVYLARLVATGLVEHRVRLRDHNRPEPVEPDERLQLTAQAQDALRVKP